AVGMHRYNPTALKLVCGTVPVQMDRLPIRLGSLHRGDRVVRVEREGRPCMVHFSFIRPIAAMIHLVAHLQMTIAIK
ncbi:MAG: hypothetical protein SW127_20600, partial [Actinomycetota bacterium]|nr:hypothetical protein [Actinomycetota bacterium]